MIILLNFKNKLMSIRSSSEKLQSHVSHVSQFPIDGCSPQEEHNENVQSRRLKIPHIAKRLNKIEKHIRLYSQQAVNFSQQKRQKYQVSFSSIYDSSKLIFQTQVPKKHSKSVFVSQIDQEICRKEKKNTGRNVNDKDNWRQQDSVSRYQTLNNLEHKYIDMKLLIKKNKIELPRIIKNRNQAQSQLQNRYQQVSPDDIDKKLKSTIIEEEGKRYYGDIHLIKKGRDKVTSSLSKMGQSKNGSSLSSYHNIINEITNQRQQIAKVRAETKSRILQERQQKKNKMLINRHLHGNVYYNALSLSKKQKNNIIGHCKFPVNYGMIK